MTLPIILLTILAIGTAILFSILRITHGGVTSLMSKTLASFCFVLLGVVVVFTHPVGNNSAFFRCRCHNFASRAHTKCICTSASKMARKLIVCSGESFIIKSFFILKLIYIFSFVSYSKTYRKRLPFHIKALLEHHFIGFP